MGLDKWSEDQIDSKMELIQEAMDEAYRRHTQSITDAVHNVVAHRVDAEPLNPKSNANVLTVQERIAKAVSAAYERRRGSGDWCRQWNFGYSHLNLWSQQEQWSGYEQGQ